MYKGKYTILMGTDSQISIFSEADNLEDALIMVLKQNKQNNGTAYQSMRIIDGPHESSPFILISEKRYIDDKGSCVTDTIAGYYIHKTDRPDTKKLLRKIK